MIKLALDILGDKETREKIGIVIPEKVLEQLSADVLKTVEFDVAQLEKQIEYIDICQDCTVKFYICDGRVETRTWQIRSRAESWTPEMREEARRKSCRKSQ